MGFALADGLQTVCAFLAIGLMAWSGGSTLTAHSDLEAQRLVALDLLRQLHGEIDEVKLNWTLQNATRDVVNDILNETVPVVPDPEFEQVMAQKLAEAEEALQEGQRHLAETEYHRVDEDVVVGLNGLAGSRPSIVLGGGGADGTPGISGLPANDVNVTKIADLHLKEYLGILMPLDAAVGALGAVAFGVGSVVFSFRR